MSRTRAITAIFGGQRVVFSLPDGPRTETVFAGRFSPFKLYQALAAGEWSAFDVRFILTFAYGGRGLVYSPEVDAVMRRAPAGIYAPLAAKILEAHLFGIALLDADFDEQSALSEPA